MLTSEFDYNLPLDLIAQSPLESRDQSRLMIVDREKQTVEHHNFFEIVNYLRQGDLLVWNNTKVFKARLRGEILSNEGAKVLNAAPVEIFLVRPMENKFVWKVLAKPGKRLRLGMKIKFAPDFFCEIMLKEKDGTVLVQFEDDDLIVRAKANQYGEVPTPPYVKNPKSEIRNPKFDEQYQTVYAKHEGSVAAPTAGFHFTPELIEDLRRRGIEFAEVTLHVGLGTFLPVKTDVVEEHKMHSEWVELTAKNADLINQAKAEKRRVVAVGTTTVRVLEGIAQKFPISNFQFPILRPYTGDINIFITPGFKFQIVDALITNFHLPKSTLLMLVSAFADSSAKAVATVEASADKSALSGREFILQCYQKAIEQKYRFFSFGDAMFVE